MSTFIKIPAFIAGRAIVDPESGAPTNEFLRTLNNNNSNIKVSVNQLADIIETQNQMLDDIELSLQQAGIAVQTAEQVLEQMQAQAYEQNLVSSYCDPNLMLTAVSPAGVASITIDPHERVYGDGTRVEVDGAVINGLTALTIYYIYYDDPAREGGAVSYHATKIASEAAQGNGRHTCGGVRTPTIDGPPMQGGGTNGPGIPMVPWY